MSTSIVYPSFKSLLIGSQYNIKTADLNVVLVNSTYTTKVENGTYISHDNISDLIAGDKASNAGVVTLYQPHGIDLSDDGYYSIVKTTKDAAWNNSNITATGAVVYDDDGNLICYVDFGGSKTSKNSSFIVPLTRGVLQIA